MLSILKRRFLARLPETEMYSSKVQTRVVGGASKVGNFKHGLMRDCSKSGSSWGLFHIKVLVYFNARFS